MPTSRVVATTVIVTVVVAVVLFATWMYSGIYDPAATRAGDGIIDRTLGTLTNRSIEARAKLLPPPPALDSAALLGGTERFHALCVGCHGGPGVPRDVIGEGLVPPAPDLSKADRTEAEIYWVIRNGLRDRGMPSYHQSHSDDQLWSIARFAKRTAGMSAAEYEAVFLEVMKRSDASPAPAHMH